MANKTIKRFPAQLPPDLHQWATLKAKELDVPVAAIWRGVTPMLKEAEQLGVRLAPEQPQAQA
jgi:hypothetical protein